MSKRGDREFLMDMLIACEKIMKYTRDLSYEDFRRNDNIITVDIPPLRKKLEKITKEEGWENEANNREKGCPK